MDIETLRQQLTYCKQNGWLPFFEKAAKDHNLELPVLLAIASRETNMKNIVGDAGHGRGIMQIDDRSHEKFLDSHQDGMDPASNINYGASVLAGNLKYFHGDYTKAIPAYNCGAGNVNKAVNAGLDPDSRTAHGNYGKDVLSRALLFKQLLLEG